MFAFNSCSTTNWLPSIANNRSIDFFFFLEKEILNLARGIGLEGARTNNKYDFF